MNASNPVTKEFLKIILGGRGVHKVTTVYTTPRGVLFDDMPPLQLSRLVHTPQMFMIDECLNKQAQEFIELIRKDLHKPEER